MLKQTDKDKLKALGLDIDAIIAAHTDTAEKDIVVPEGEFLTPEQKATFGEVKLKEGEKTGEQKATAIAKAEIKKHAGIDLKGERWGDIGTEIKTAINSTGDEKVKTLQEQNALLLKDVDKYKGDANAAAEQLKTGMFEIGILSKLPANSLGLSPKEAYELAKIRGYQPELTETGTVWKKNGEVMKDPATHAPLPEDKAIKAIWEEQKWIPAAQGPQGGRGPQQKPTGGSGAGLMSKSQVEAAWEEQNPGKGIATPEGMAFYGEYAKQPGFDMFN